MQRLGGFLEFPVLVKRKKGGNEHVRHINSPVWYLDAHDLSKEFVCPASLLIPAATRAKANFYKSVSPNKADHVERINFMVRLLPLTCAQIYEDHETCSGRGPTGFGGQKLDVWVFGAHSKTFFSFLGGDFRTRSGWQMHVMFINMRLYWHVDALIRSRQPHRGLESLFYSFNKAR